MLVSKGFPFFLLGLGFVRSKANSSFFVLHSPIGILLILIYGDDITVTGLNSLQVIQSISPVGKEFSLNEIGQLHCLFGIEVIQIVMDYF